MTSFCECLKNFLSCSYCSKNQSIDEEKIIVCPNCHYKIVKNQLNNQIIDKNTNDDSKSNIINGNILSNKIPKNLNNKNDKNQPLIIHQNNYISNHYTELKEMDYLGPKNIKENIDKSFEEKNKLLEEKSMNLNKKEKKLNDRELQIQIKENSLDLKNKELNDREQQLKNKLDSLSQQENKLNEFESYKNKEIVNLKNKEDKLNKLEKELNEKEKSILNQNEQAKILKENLLNLKQKEESLRDQELKLKNDINKLEIEKKYFEKEKELFELSKLPNEVGLQNIGATCYMNATLQALSNTNKFTQYFLNKYKYNPNDVSKKMSNEIYKVLINLWSDQKKKGDYPPYDFKNALSEENSLFAGVKANDSKDLINFLLERFHQEMNTGAKVNNNSDEIVNQLDEEQTFNAFVKEYFSTNKSIIIDCFYGIIETRSRCGGCNITKYNFQIYSFLEFPLKEVNAFMYQNGRRVSLVNNDGTNPDINLYECFDYYQKIDIMNGQNQMYCNICNGNRDTYYGTTLSSLPNYLVINLNRGKGATYACKVIFPEILNLFNYISLKNGNTVMQLYAVICHYGPSSMSGHFIAYCRHRVNNKWYKYNDSIVTECTQKNEYYNGMPYILFYKAIDA